MDEPGFREWLLREQGQNDASAGTRLSSARRVEAALGDLDKLLDAEGLDAVLDQFRYSREDQRHGRANPSPVPINGNLYNGLASLALAIKHYSEFRTNETPNRKSQAEWVSQVTDVEVFAAMDDCYRIGLDGFLQQVGFGKPRRYVQRKPDASRTYPDERLYPAKAIIAAAIAKLPDGPVLHAKAFFNGFGEAESFARLEALGFKLVTPSEAKTEKFNRAVVEAAMDAYDAHKADGSHDEVFGAFGDPRDYWVRSTRPEKPIYPTKPLVGYVLERTRLNGGWNREAAATLLHNAGYIIVDADGHPQPPPRHSYLLREADRIRACARNYYIEPARETGASAVRIRAGDLAREMGLTNAHPNICSALGSREFREMLGTPPPKATEPNPSSTTVFTFTLGGEGNVYPTEAQQEHDAIATIPPTNLILYGPPGTGKTFETAAEALRLCGVDVPDDRARMMGVYEGLRKDKRIEFVTFHQSTSYEDFVEGRQPVTDGADSDSAGFRLETIRGVFREIAERAERGVAASSEEETISLDGRQLFKLSIGRADLDSDNYLFEESVEQGHILIGWENIDFSDERYEDPEEILAICKADGQREGQVSRQSGQVKMIDIFRNKLDLGDIVIVTKGNKLVRAIGEVTGDYEYVERDTGVYCHRRKTRWLWIDPEGIPAEDIYERQFVQATTYRLRKEDLKIAVLERYMNSGLVRDDHRSLPFVLIIDEINRANISKVFGELITLLEPDKRLGQPNALTVRLPYSRQDFGVPSNLHILGTMNTADRSIALLDTALRRRFLFREMMPKPEVLEDAAAHCGLDLPRLLRRLNERIEYFYDREHQIGHAYFINCRSRQDVDETLRHKVIPLLAEYFFEDWSKVAAVLGDARADEGVFNGGFMRREILTPPPGLEDNGDGAVRFRWSLRSQDEGFDYAGLIG